MKTNVNYIILIVFLIGLSSCEKYLDIKRANTQNPINNANDLQLLLDNVATMNTDLPSDMNLSVDDFYVDDNIYSADNLGISSEDRDKYIWSSSAIRKSADTQWQRPYFIVYNANLVLEYIEKFRGKENEQVLNKIKGAALFYRTWGHWQISQLYAKQYNKATAAQDAGIPLRLTSDINGEIVRSTVQQTYDRMLQDLKESLDLLPNSAFVSSQPSKVAAYAMLARVNLSMGNYSEALTSATSCLQLNNQLLDFNTISKTALQPFTIYNKEVLFHSATVTSPLLTPGTETAPIAKIDPALASSYDSNDLRGQLYIKPNLGAGNVGTYRFTGNYSFSAVSAFFNGLAIDEIYLTRAECYARNGNFTAAMADLNNLLRTRYVTGTYIDVSVNNADEALVKILTERRKELLMRGMRWTDLRRLNFEGRFTKILTRNVQGVIYTLPPNDSRYVLLIPNEVIQIGAISQNIR